MVPFHRSIGSYEFPTHRSASLSHSRRTLRVLKEMWRVLAPGGTLRITTPDLELYARGYVAAADRRRREGVRVGTSAAGDPFLREVYTRVGASMCMGCPETPTEEDLQARQLAGTRSFGAGSVLNFAMRSWGHRWFFDMESMVDAMVEAGIPKYTIARDAYRSQVLPVELQSCDREDRNHESLYVHAVKPMVKPWR